MRAVVRLFRILLFVIEPSIQALSVTSAILKFEKSVYKADTDGDGMNWVDTCANCHHDILHHHFPSSEEDRKYDTIHYCKICECPELKETSRVTLHTVKCNLT